MVTRRSHIILFALLLCLGSSVLAQRHVFSEIGLNKQRIYVGEPVEVSVSIYTSTWFTKGLNFGNIKVNGAFTVFFRSVPTSKTVNGRKYSGVMAIYNVFPYDDKDLIFPSLEFTVETPQEGGYQGERVQVKTSERKIDVLSIPNGFERDEWLVASGLSLNESWQGNLEQVKVGDVIQRSVTRRVNGTVSELIPPLKWDSIAGVSNYPTRSEVSNEKTKTSIYSIRTEGNRYLFENEGPVTIPEIEVSWWNPAQKKLFKRTLQSRSFEVLPNPDLGMLESARDSLAIAMPVDKEDSTEKPRRRISRTKILLISILTLILIKLVLKIYKYVFITKMIAKRIRDKRAAYRQTEPYFFRQFRKSVLKGNEHSILNDLYRWVDRLQLQEPTLECFARNYGNEELKAFADDIPEEMIGKKFKEQFRNFGKARRRYLKNLTSRSAVEEVWINP